MMFRSAWRALILAAVVVTSTASVGCGSGAGNAPACPTCNGTGARSCGASDCTAGQVPCTAPCLKKETPGWEKRDVPGFSPDLLWVHVGGGSYVSQNHLGQVVNFDGGSLNLRSCVTCGGTTRLPCPACKGKNPCLKCKGKRTI